MLTSRDELTKLYNALEIVCRSEHVADEAENANHHGLVDFLREIQQYMHVCDFNGERHEYDGGDYEVECTNTACWNTKYVEGNE